MQRKFSLWRGIASLIFRGASERGKAKRLLPRRSKSGRGDQLHFYQREPTTTPTPEPYEYWLSHYNGGAQDIINNTAPANFATIQVNPVKGDLHVYRP